jgi:hypothetical protein
MGGISAAANTDHTTGLAEPASAAARADYASPPLATPEAALQALQRLGEEAARDVERLDPAKTAVASATPERKLAASLS